MLNQLERCHFSTAFMSALCVDINYGFAHNTSMTVAILEKVIEHADRTVVLLDSSKVRGGFYPHTIPLSSVDILVTDDAFPADVAKQLEAKGLTVI